MERWELLDVSFSPSFCCFSLIQSWYNKNVTRLITQGCNSIVISWLWRTCWKKLATTLIISTKLSQVVNSLFQTCRQLEKSSANTTCRRLVGRLATRCEIFMPVHSCIKICTHTVVNQAFTDWSSHVVIFIFLAIKANILATSSI
jgi:hypothetical protein